MNRANKFLYLIIYIALLCGCERLELPDQTEGDEDTEESPASPLPDLGEDEIRDGSREAPYIVSHVQEIMEEYSEVSDAWVEGYIVGWISGSHYPNGARFTAQAAGTTNLLLADSIFENDPANCIPIQLPANTEVRQELNLADNPQNLRRHVKVKGNIARYFNTAGVVDVTLHEWMSASAMEDEKKALSVIELNEDFSTFDLGDSLALKDWSIIAFYMPHWHVQGNRLERYAAICHTDTFSNRSFEYWLITPPINLSRMKKPVFSFSTAYENWDNNSRLETFIISEKDPFKLGLLPFLETTIAQPETVGEGQWVHSGDIGLHSYSGILYIGFRYKGLSTGKRATTFRIDDIKLEELEE